MMEMESPYNPYMDDMEIEQQFPQPPTIPGHPIPPSRPDQRYPIPPSRPDQGYPIPPFRPDQGYPIPPPRPAQRQPALPAPPPYAPTTPPHFPPGAPPYVDPRRLRRCMHRMVYIWRHGGRRPFWAWLTAVTGQNIAGYRWSERRRTWDPFSMNIHEIRSFQCY
ncbi:hypothetical protein [Thermoflavimicrobium dichotomicum]|nr:hypothetical protein [Thermoflavimicrobium dichotomicum]